MRKAAGMLALACLWPAPPAHAQAAASSAPWAPCAAAVVEAVRAEAGTGTFRLEGALTDPGGRLDYLGAAILRDAQTLLPPGDGTPLAFEGTLVDRSTDIVVAARVRGTAADCALAKSPALAEALRVELQALRTQFLAEADRIAGVLGRGVWKEGPAFSTGAAPASVAPSSRPLAVWLSGGVALGGQPDAGSQVAAAMRTRDGRWEGGLSWNQFGIDRKYEFTGTAIAGGSAAGSQHRHLAVHSFTLYAARHMVVPRVLSFASPGWVGAGAGLSLSHLNESAGPFHQYRTAPTVDGHSAVRLNPTLLLAAGRSLGDSLELQAAYTYLLLANPVGPANAPWGGGALNLGLAWRVY